MEYLRATVVTNHMAADSVSELLMRCGAHGTQIIDRQDVPDEVQLKTAWATMDQDVLDAMPVDVHVLAWFATPTEAENARAMVKTLPGTLGFDAGPLDVTLEAVQDEDWAENWKQYYKPMRVGKHLVIKPGWEAFDAGPNDLVIELDPGMAFGTGTHETTRLCLELLEAWYTEGPVLDVGTGSGILAIAAAKLGAKDVLAVDIDPVAVNVADENVRINNLSGRVRVAEGDLVQGVGGTYSFACANILADIIIALAGPIRAHLVPDAVFVCSGILIEREDDVVAALTGAGFELLEARHLGAWTALAARLT